MRRFFLSLALFLLAVPAWAATETITAPRVRALCSTTAPQAANPVPCFDQTDNVWKTWDGSAWWVDGMPSYTVATLPACTTSRAGRMYYLTNGIKGPWICTGTANVLFQGFIETKWFTGLADLGAQIQAAHDLSATLRCLTATGCTIETGDFVTAQTLSAVTITKDVHLIFGCGTYLQTGTFKVDNAEPTIDSPTCASISWKGNTTGPVLDLHGMGGFRGGRIRGLRIGVSNAFPVLDAIRIVQDVSGAGLSSNLILENIEINCTLGTLGSCRYGVHWDSPNGLDANNDLTQMTNVKAYSYGGGAGMTVRYVGAGTFATISNTGSTLSTTVTGGPGGEDLSLSLSAAAYDTLGELVAYIDGLAAYTATIGTGPWTTSSTPSRELAIINQEAISNAAFTANLFSAAFFVEGTQSGYHRCKGCIADGNQVQGTSGVLIGSYRVAGWGFSFQDGHPNANDFGLNMFNGTGNIVWRNNNSENTRQMVRVTGNNLWLDISNNREATQRMFPAGEPIYIVGNGTTRVDGNFFNGTIGGCGSSCTGKIITGLASGVGGLLRLTLTGHSLETGDYINIHGIGGRADISSARVNKIDANTVDVVGYLYSAANTVGGTISRMGKVITGAVDNGSGLIRLTIVAHGLTTGDPIAVDSVLGTTEANRWWLVTNIGAATVDLQGSVFTNAYTSGGIAWLDQNRLNCTMTASPSSLATPVGGVCAAKSNAITSAHLYPFTPSGYWQGSGNYSTTPTNANDAGNSITFTAGPQSFLAGDATPDVSLGQLFYTANGSAKTITAFRNMSPGQSFVVWVNDANTTLGCATTATLKCNNGANVLLHSADIVACTAYSTTVALCTLPSNARNWGATSVADGGTIAHAMGATPASCTVSARTSGEFASATALDGTNITVAIKKHDGTGGTTALVDWDCKK